MEQVERELLRASRTGTLDRWLLLASKFSARAKKWLLREGVQLLLKFGTARSIDYSSTTFKSLPEFALRFLFRLLADPNSPITFLGLCVERREHAGSLNRALATGGKNLLTLKIRFHALSDLNALVLAQLPNLRRLSMHQNPVCFGTEQEDVWLSSFFHELYRSSLTRQPLRISFHQCELSNSLVQQLHRSSERRQVPIIKRLLCSQVEPEAEEDFLSLPFQVDSNSSDLYLVEKWLPLARWNPSTKVVVSLSPGTIELLPQTKSIEMRYLSGTRKLVLESATCGSDEYHDRVTTILTKLPVLRQITLAVPTKERLILVLRALQGSEFVGALNDRRKVIIVLNSEWRETEPFELPVVPTSKRQKISLVVKTPSLTFSQLAMILRLQPFGARKLKIRYDYPLGEFVGASAAFSLGTWLGKNKWIQSLSLNVLERSGALNLLKRAIENQFIQKIDLCVGNCDLWCNWSDVFADPAFPALRRLTGFEVSKEEESRLFRYHSSLALVGERSVCVSKTTLNRTPDRTLTEIAFANASTRDLPLEWISSDKCPKFLHPS